MKQGTFLFAVVAIAAMPALVYAQSATAQSTAGRIDLACNGGGGANRSSTGTVRAWNNYGDTATGTVVTNQVVGFDDEVRLWINADDGRIRMPRAMLPVVRGGENGWFKLKSIKFTDHEITGAVAVNVINNPKLRIDRMTGSISISGKAGDYSGRCIAYDPNKTERAF